MFSRTLSWCFLWTACQLRHIIVFSIPWLLSVQTYSPYLTARLWSVYLFLWISPLRVLLSAISTTNTFDTSLYTGSLISSSLVCSIPSFSCSLTGRTSSCIHSCTSLFRTIRCGNFWSSTVYRSVCWPIDTIPNRFSIAAENWEGPKPTIHAENLFHISCESNIINAFVRLTLSFKILNSSLVACC